MKESVKPILLTSYDLVKKEPKIFTTNGCGSDYFIRDIVSGATSAPTIFEPFPLDGMLLIDALYAKNPSLIALSETIRSLGKEVKDTFILSIGTGYEIPSNTEKKFVPPTSGMAFISSICDSIINTHSTTHVIIDSILPVGNTLRLDLPIPSDHMDFTDISEKNITFLIEETGRYLEKNLDSITEFIQKIKKKPDTTPSYIG